MAFDKKAWVKENRVKLNAQSAAWVARNKKQHAEACKRWHQNNKEHVAAVAKKWRMSNDLQMKQMRADWRCENPAKLAFYSATYHCTKLKATPKWLTGEQKQEIQAYYDLAKELQWLSEEVLEVDHIIPLQGKGVVGLHVPWNLQILPKSKNISKNNRY